MKNWIILFNKYIPKGFSTRTPSSTKNPRAGFTLVELLIVLSIIAMIMGFVVNKLGANYEKAKITSTQIQIKQLESSLLEFKRICGYYPTTDQGLDALVKAPSGRPCKNYDPEGIIKKVPQDAWNVDFLYESDGNKYKITSHDPIGGRKDITSDDE